MNNWTKLANAMLVIGYGLMLNVHPIFVVFKLLGSSILIYFFLKEKKYDIVATLSFFTAIDLNFFRGLL